jgi:hypothetical protein
VSEPVHPYTAENGFEVWAIGPDGEEVLLSKHPHQNDALRIAGTFLMRVGAPALRALNTYDFQGVPSIVVDSPGMGIKSVVKGAILTNSDRTKLLPDGDSTDYVGSMAEIQE